MTSPTNPTDQSEASLGPAHDGPVNQSPAGEIPANKSPLEKDHAVLLINLGTPDAPEENAIRRYLKQFLSDPRVVDFPRWLWLPILNGIILRTRPPKLVEKYQLIWGTKDGPIRNITHALGRRLQSLMPDVHVATAMTYGSPSVASVLDGLTEYKKLTVLPLFPQYAGATTAAVRDELDRALAGRENQWEVQFIEEYHTRKSYITALAESIRENKAFREGKATLIFSFHGIPQSQAKAGDPYPVQCEATAKHVAHALKLKDDQWRMTYQSRFGPLPWLQPYTDKTMEALPDQGVKEVLVVCPGFSADCLETVEEIRVLNREIFEAAGGITFNYVKALNASWRHAETIKDLITNRDNP